MFNTRAFLKELNKQRKAIDLPLWRLIENDTNSLNRYSVVLADGTPVSEKAMTHQELESFLIAASGQLKKTVNLKSESCELCGHRFFRSCEIVGMDVYSFDQQTGEAVVTGKTFVHRNCFNSLQYNIDQLEKKIP